MEAPADPVKMDSSKHENDKKALEKPASFFRFIQQQGVRNVSQFVDQYAHDTETRHRTHAYMRSVIGISSFWAAPLFGVTGALLAFLFPAAALSMLHTADEAISRFWFTLPAPVKMIGPVLAIGSVLMMWHLFTIPIVSQVSWFIGAVFAFKLGMGLYMSNWEKEMEQANQMTIAKKKKAF